MFDYSRKQISKDLKDYESILQKIISRLISSSLLIITVIILGSLFCILSTFLGILSSIIDNTPRFQIDDLYVKGYSSKILDSKGKLIETISNKKKNQEYVSSKKIPKLVKEAFIVIEDENFLKHHGVDVNSILLNTITGIENGFKFDSDNTSITQKLIQNHHFNRVVNNSILDKLINLLQEQYLSLELEKTISKDKILEYYLNTINLGQGCFGVNSASQRYFGKNVESLNLSEATTLAAIANNPSMLNPIKFPNNNNNRRKEILDKMEILGLINSKEKNIALKDQVYSRIKTIDFSNREDRYYSYFVDELIDDVITDLQEKLGYSESAAYYALYSGGLVIKSTQDSSLQKLCNKECNDISNFPNYGYKLNYSAAFTDDNGNQINIDNKELIKYCKKNKISNNLIFSNKKIARIIANDFKNYYIENHPKYRFISDNISIIIEPQASMILMNHNNGNILAMVGGRGKRSSNNVINRAINPFIHPDSQIKIPAIYAPALDIAGYTLAQVEEDAPYSYNNTIIKNNYNGYNGLTTIREAINNSSNVIAVKTIQKLSTQLSYGYLKDFGITSLVSSDANNPWLALGYDTKVSNLELTNAYASIYNGGDYYKPKFYTKIYDSNHKLILDNSNISKKRVIKDTTAYLLIDAMRGNIKNSDDKNCKIDGCDIAGQNSINGNNLWFIGSSPYYTCSIWSGIDGDVQYSKTKDNYHTKIWKNVMSKANKNLGYKKILERPSNITNTIICKKSGLLPINNICVHDPRGHMLFNEIFLSGTEPTNYCDRHIEVNVKKDVNGKKEIKKEVLMHNMPDIAIYTKDAPYIYTKDN